LLRRVAEHSDPEKLREAAGSAQDDKTQEQRAAELQAVIAAMRQAPTEADIMKQEIATLTDDQKTDSDKLSALQLLRELVRPIDNANDLKVLGGLPPIIGALGSSSSDVKAEAARVLGTAASNNPRVQKDVHQSCADIIQRLMQLLDASSALAVQQGIFALGCFLRNDAAARAQFYSLGGLAPLQRLAVDPASAAAQSRAVNLLADLAGLGLPEKSLTPAFLAALLEPVQQPLTSTKDVDWAAVERNVLLIQALVSSSSEVAAYLQTKGLSEMLDGLKPVLAASIGKEPTDGDQTYFEHLLELVKATGGASGQAAQRRGTDSTAGQPAAAQEGSSDPDDATAASQQEVLQLGGPTTGIPAASSTSPGNGRTEAGAKQAAHDEL